MSKENLSLLDVIDVMRAVDSPDGVRPSVAQVRRLIEDMWQMVPIGETAARDEFAGFTQKDLVEIAKSFGVYRARVARGTLDTVPRTPANALFPFEEDLRVKVQELLANGVKPFRSNGTRNTRSSRNPNGFPLELFPVLDEVLSQSAPLPPGYDRWSGWGNFHKSLASIYAQRPDDAELIRFVDRTYATLDIELSADHVWLLRWFTDQGLTERLLEIAGQSFLDTMGQTMLLPTAERPANYPLCQVFVKAFDAVEEVRKQAQRALAGIVSEEITEPGEVYAVLRGSAWMSPVRVDRLLTVAKRAAEPGSPARMLDLFRQNLRAFRWDVQTFPSEFLVGSFEELTDASVLQIVRLLDLPTVDNKEEREVARRVSIRLSQMGLKRDRDVELPEAMRAWRLGILDDFWVSRQARMDGDPDWEADYLVKVSQLEVAS